MPKKIGGNRLAFADADLAATGGQASGLNRDAIEEARIQLTAALAANTNWTAGIVTDVGTLITACTSMVTEIDSL